MNNIEILEKLKDEQYDKETLKTICMFYDEKFKPYVLSTEEREAIENLIQENKELKKDKLELINKNHVVHLKDVEKELREMRKAIDTKNAEIECLNVIHESYKEMVKENNFISKDKIKELRDIDNIDLLQTKTIIRRRRIKWKKKFKKNYKKYTILQLK